MDPLGLDFGYTWWDQVKEESADSAINAVNYHAGCVDAVFVGFEDNRTFNGRPDYIDKDSTSYKAGEYCHALFFALAAIKYINDATGDKTPDTASEGCKDCNSGEPTTKLYHGGSLKGDKVQGNRAISTSPSREHAEKYADQPGDTITEFEVPTKWLREMEAKGYAQPRRDKKHGTPGYGDEIRFHPAIAEELNKYRR